MNLTQLLAVLAIFAPLVWKIVDTVKFVFAGDTNAWVTQLVTWFVAVGVALLVWQSNIGDSSTVHSLNWASILLGGLSMGSIASAGYDYKKAKDGSDSAVTPSLLGGQRTAKRQAAKAKATKTVT